MKRITILTCLFILVSPRVFAQFKEQKGMVSTDKNYTGFKEYKKLVDLEVLQLNKGKEQHPEIGQLFAEAPCEDCFEIIEKRTPTSKHFVKKGTNGSYVYQQASAEAMHLIDANGNYITVNQYLSPNVSIPGLFSANIQPVPVGIYTNERYSYIGKENQRLYFNRNLTLVFVPTGGEEQVIGAANWTNYTAGSDGIYITDVWPGIDMEMKVARGQLKTNYIIKHQLPEYTNGTLRIRDRLLTDPGLTINALGENEFFGEIEILDKNKNVFYLIEPAIAYDQKAIQSGIKNPESSTSLNYSLDGQQLDIIIPQEWINRDPAVYPIIIDPLVSGTATLAQSSIPGTAFNSTCFTNGCIYDLTVPVPAAITVTDIRWSFTYVTGSACSGTCWLRDGAVDFLMPPIGGCRSPNNTSLFWFCNLNAGGTCTGTNISIFADLQACIPAPQCAGYNMAFRMNFYRCYCSSGGCSNTCIGSGSPWTMVVEGRTVEVAGNVTTLPAVTICQGQCTTLSTTAQNGVAPYSYVWNPGNLPGSPSVCPASTTIYTVTVTDACGLSAVTATKTVNVNLNNNPGFTITPNPACIGQTVTVSGGGTASASSYDWTLPGSSSPTVNNTQTFNVTYAASGVNAITLNFVGNGGCIFPLVQNITINPNVTPSITIAASATTICAGTSVTFTSSITNGGGSPGYQWRLNGSNIAGATASSYTTTTLINGDIITCVLTSNAPCASPNPVTSNSITMTVNPILVPTITISAVPSGAICAGTNVVFTATITNGGGSPTYQWQLNGANIPGATSSSYATTTLVNGDQIRCVLTSNALCASPNPVTSNTITMTVNPNVTPTIVISITSGTNPTCAGVNVTFSAAITNGGGSPGYQWQVNGGNIPGATSSTYSTTTLSNGNIVTCVLTSNAPCASPNPVTSNSITMTVNPVLVPTVSIAVSPAGTVCVGTVLNFTSSITNGGSSPTYQWQLNGTNIGGATSSTYLHTTTLANNGQVITLVLTSNALCASPTSVTSAGITMSVTATVAPTITISASATTICAGTMVLFTSSITNGGGGPTYQWQLNSVNIGGATASSYSTTTLVNGDVITCILTSNNPCASPTTATSNSITMTVTANTTPTITIAASATTICAGTNVNFTSTITNGGGGPTYQWQLNSVNIGGATSSTYSTTTLINGDVIRCILTSNDPCASPLTVTSNTITMTVNAVVVPTISISAVPAGAICAGTSVTFTATITNGGGSPIYQWQINGVNVGTNSFTYSSSTLANGNIVTCILTSNAVCASPNPVTSNSITMVVNAVVVPSISIAAVPAGAICSGTSVTFTATITNGGGTPTYQWQVNTVNVGFNLDTYSSSTLANGDIVTCILTSNAPCASPNPVTSNSITMSVSSTATPTINIVASPAGDICAGTNVTFTANITNGGGAPSYQWQVNSGNVGTDANTYSSTTLVNGDVVTCILTSNAACASPTTVTSNAITMVVNPVLVPTINISVAPSGAVCSGTNVTFTASITNGGGTPVYQWQVNGINAGTNSNTYSDSTLINGDVVNCILTSSALCASPNPITSNNIVMNIIPSAPASISIVVSPAGVICAGTIVDFTASTINEGGFPSYQWQLNGANIGGATASTYSTTTLVNGDVITCILISSATCASPITSTSNSIVMTVLPPLGVPTFPVGTTQRCMGIGFDTYTTTAVGATSYIWIVTGAGNTILSTGPSGLVSWDANYWGAAQVCVQAVGCGAFSSTICTGVIVDTLPLTPVITVTGDTTFCDGLTATLNSSYSFNNLWTPNLDTTNSIIVTQSGTYAVEHTDSNGCKSTSAGMVIAVFTDTINLSVLYQPVVCPGTPFNMVASGNNVVSDSVFWSTGDTAFATSPQTITSQTNYFVSVVNNNGCIADSAFTVDVYFYPDAIADFDVTNQDTAVCSYILINDNPNSGNIIYITTPPINGSILNGPILIAGDSICYQPIPGYYGPDFFYYAICNPNCPNDCDTTLVTITVNPSLIIPPGFSPNGDGVNDILTILGLVNYPQNSLRIINRWGDLIYSADPYTNNWDGRSNTGINITSGVVTDGTYFYIFISSPGAVPTKGALEIRTGQ